MLQLFAIIASIWTLVQESKFKKLRLESLQWTKVRGKITVVKNRIIGLPKITYTYMVDGQEKSSSQLFFAQSLAMDLLKELRNGKLKAGDEVDVYYSPTETTNAVLFPGQIRGQEKAVYFTTGILVLMGISIAWQIAML